MTLADVQITVRDGAVIARVTGEIDMSNAGDLRTAIPDATPIDALGSGSPASRATWTSWQRSMRTCGALASNAATDS